MVLSTWRSAVLQATTPSALEVFRRLPSWLRRGLTRLITPNYTLGVVAVCQDGDGRALLVRSRHHDGWALPGGLVRRGEEPVAGLARELTEELSIQLRPDELARGGTATIIDASTQQVTVVVAVTLPAVPEVDGTEVVQAAWFTVTDLPRPLVRGTAESLAAVGALGTTPSTLR